MPNSDERMVRGLSIAVLVLSILAIVFMLGVLGLIGLSGAAISDPDVANSAILQLESDPAVTDELSALDLSGEDIIGITALGFGLASVALVWVLICAVVSMIAAIIGMRNYNKPQKLGSVFGWAIAGAILTFLSGLIIQTVLLIIVAVYANKLRKASTAIPYGQPQPMYAQQGYAQPMQQGYAQQPASPQDPAQPHVPPTTPEQK